MDKHVYLVKGFDKEVFACYSNRLSALRHAKCWNHKDGEKTYYVERIPLWEKATYKDYQDE